MAKARVAVTPCGNYDIERVRRAVRESLAQLPEAERLLTPGRKVLLKPNLLSSNKGPEQPVNTHPAVVRAVAEFLIERGCKVSIGDSCGSVRPGATDKALLTSGLTAIAADTGAKIINFDRAPCQRLGSGKFPEIMITNAVKDAEVIINLPKLKTHGLTFLTGAVKNLYGTIPGKGKKTGHVMAPKPAALAEILVDLLAAIRPQLTIMDAIIEIGRAHV
jgi:uncharacterized protein (DUF362 family)